MNDELTPFSGTTDAEPIGLAGLTPTQTLGQRLAAQAQQMLGRRAPAPAWLQESAPLLERLAALPTPGAARFQRVELGSEPLLLAPRVHPSRVDTGPEGAGYEVGTAKSSAIASFEDQSHLVPDMGAHDTIRHSVSSVAGPGVKLPGDMDALAKPAPVSLSTRTRDTIRPSFSSSIGPPLETTGDRDAQPEDRLVSPEVRMRLSDLAGPTLPAIRVRDDIQADAIARDRQADAVTIGNQVLFRADRYRPHTPRGVALLAHEATHVAQAQQPGVTWRRATAAGRADDERQALFVERAVLHTALGTPSDGPSPQRDDLRPQSNWPMPAMPAVEGAGGLPASVQPMAASTGRNLQEEPAPSAPAPAMPAVEGAGGLPASVQPMAASTGRNLQEEPAPSAPAPAFLELREALYRDLMRQLRADFERGG